MIEVSFPKFSRIFRVTENYPENPSKYVKGALSRYLATLKKKLEGAFTSIEFQN